MKELNLQIDIMKLSTADLLQLQKMFYFMNRNKEAQIVNERIAFIEGWMSGKEEKEYIEKYHS